MKLELTIAALCCFLLAVGHTAIGWRWILPGLTNRALLGTPFGSSRLSLGMLRFTWHVVSILLLGFGVLLITMAFAPGADTKTLVLRWLTGLWLAATAMAVWQARRRPSTIVRFPVPVVTFVIAAMTWIAST
jgi:hypothetical protein